MLFAWMLCYPYMTVLRFFLNCNIAVGSSRLDEEKSQKLLRATHYNHVKREELVVTP